MSKTVQCFCGVDIEIPEDTVIITGIVSRQCTNNHRLYFIQKRYFLRRTKFYYLIAITNGEKPEQMERMELYHLSELKSTR